jgi:hypothetical protein
VEFEPASGATLQVLTGVACANITERAADGGGRVTIVKRAGGVDWIWHGYVIDPASALR